MSVGKYEVRWDLQTPPEVVNWIHIPILLGNSPDLHAKLLISQVGPLGGGLSYRSPWFWLLERILINGANVPPCHLLVDGKPMSCAYECLTCFPIPSTEKR